MGLHQICLEAALHISSLLQPSDGVPQREHYARPLALLLGESSLTKHTKLTLSPSQLAEISPEL